MIDVHNTFKEPITENNLFEWHLMLLASHPNPHLKIACWRTDEEPMQIVSGHQGRWTIHYEAPPAKKIPKEMEEFILWFNQTAPDSPHALPFAAVRVAIAHLYFETIHPFEDGNGRIGRALSEKALSQGFGYNEITNWIRYFINVILQAQLNVEAQINFILKKSIFYNKFTELLNPRQLKAIQRMLQEGVTGFEGGMSAKKYMVITGTSKATATRDLQQLLDWNILKRIGSGRSTHYELNL